MILLQVPSASGIRLAFFNNLLISHGNKKVLVFQQVRVSILKVVWRFTPTELINFLLLNGFLDSNPIIAFFPNSPHMLLRKHK